ncbi:MAG TPA: type IV pilus secretin PilQ, partial [Syntrophorhabdaceae bacterium]|nr:type IV pilus secretin PilQ [Syntrophorhabdaceae bacterium]
LVVPSICLGQITRQPVPKVSFDFVDADIRNVLRVLAEVSKKNLVMGEDVKGKVTMKLDGISTSEAFDVILKSNDLAKIEEDTIIRIMTVKRFFEERDRDRKDKLEFLREKEAKEKLEDEFVTQTVFLNYADAAEMERMIKGGKEEDGKERRAIKGLLSSNGAVTLVKWNNALIVKDVKSNVDDVIRNIRQHDTPPAQVQIEARIVQASTDFSREIGIAWGGTFKSSAGGKSVTVNGINALGTTSNTGGSFNINSPASISGGTNSAIGGGISLAIGNAADRWALDVQLSALESDGKGRIISNPKVITSDNVPAKISQGKEIPYQTTSQNGTTTEFKQALLSLEVTPHVSKDGGIRLKIKATKDEPVTVEGVLAIEKRETTSEVLIRDGETVMIGGIYEITDDQSVNGLPLLKDIPLFGWLFKKDSKTNTKRELLIFITPTIIKNLYKAEG